MNEQLTTEVAHEIERWHSEAQNHANDAKVSATEALQAAVYCGSYIEQVNQETRGKMLAWLRDNVKDITPERAKAYMSLFHVHKERKEHAIDHRQLILLGVIDKVEQPATPRNGDLAASSKWVGWVGNLRGWYKKAKAERPIDQWPDDQRQAVADQIKPLVDIYREITGGEG